MPQVWDLAEGQPVSIGVAHSSEVTRASWTPDGRQVCAYRMGGWEVGDGGREGRLFMRAHSVGPLAGISLLASGLPVSSARSAGGLCWQRRVHLVGMRQLERTPSPSM